MATHSNILAWRIPWTEEPGGLQSMGSQRAGHNWATNTHIHTHTHTHTHTVRRNMSKKRTGNNGVVKAKDNSMKEEVVNSIKDHAAKSLQSCPTLCNPIDGSPPGSPIPGILQARTLEWVAISFSNAWKWTVKVKSLSCVWLLATPWTTAYQAPPPMGFSRQEYCSGVSLTSPSKTIDISIRLVDH